MNANSKSNVWLFKYMWIVAILPKMLQAVLLFAIAICLMWKRRGKIKLDFFFLMVVGYVLVHAISILTNCIFGEYETDRILAAFNTAFIWCVAIVFYNYYADSQVNGLDIAKYCFINNTVMIALAFIARFMRYVINTYTLPVTHRVLYSYDGWYSRFQGFMEYPTLVSSLVLLMTPWALYFILNKVNRPFRIPCAVIYYVLSFFPIYISYSRNGYVLFWSGAVGILFLCWKVKLGSKNKRVLAIIVGTLFLAGAVFFSQYTIALVNKLLDMRQGSNSTRMDIYKETIENLQGWNLLLGCGIKKIGRVGYPLGSHCTYLGFLYKTGIAGTLMIMAALLRQGIFLLKSLLKSQKIRDGICLLFALLMFAYFIFEDMDGCDWFLCIWFSIIGVLRRLQGCNAKESFT